MAKRKKEKVNPLKEAQNKIIILESSLDRVGNERDNLISNFNTIKKICGVSDSSYSFSADSDLKEIFRFLRRSAEAREELSMKEGQENGMLRTLTEENARLWYLVRVGMKDVTLEGGESSNHHDYVRGPGVRSPFPKPTF